MMSLPPLLFLIGLFSTVEVLTLLFCISEGNVGDFYDNCPLLPGVIHICTWGFVGIWQGYLFVTRGFDNTEHFQFCVNEQITLGGDSTYYITKEKYLGKNNKRCIEIDYYMSGGHFSSYNNYSYANPKEFSNYHDAMKACTYYKNVYDEEQMQQMINIEQKKLEKVVAKNKYIV